MLSERRNLSRIPIPLAQSATLLRRGFAQFRVHLVDQSPTGFAITGPRRLNIQRGDLLQIRTNEGWIEVRLAHIGPLETDDYPADFDCILGVERVRNLGFGPDANWLAAVGPRRAMGLVAVAIFAGVLAGSLLLAQPKALQHAAQQLHLQTLWRR
jgi:hypothetical protein